MKSHYLVNKQTHTQTVMCLLPPKQINKKKHYMINKHTKHAKDTEFISKSKSKFEVWLTRKTNAQVNVNVIHKKNQSHSLISHKTPLTN
jgi:hypothetical protein